MMLSKSLPRFLLAVLGATLGMYDLALADDQADALFVRRVWPLLSEKCLACHGADLAALKGGLDLRTQATTRSGGESRQPAIVPGQPNESPVYLAATRQHDDWSPMPPKEADKLSVAQLRWLRDWIASGASWPNETRAQEITRANAEKWSAEDGVSLKTSGGTSAEWSQRKYKPDGLWAYQPIVKPSLMQTGAAAIDTLLERRLPNGATRAPTANARVFIRRASFDLLGLPPTPDEVTAFGKAFAKDADAAVKELIERLLASPHYGERMAQHWLDVVRYADSSGFANDYERGNAWRYRDYVVRSFNADQPYDQFVREQLAGDEIYQSLPDAKRHSDLLIATGFLRMGPWELTGMEVAKVARQRFLDDVTNSVGETFLAHSLQCARCHDHKFDPVPTRDYYGIQAVFATTQLTERPAPFSSLENTQGFGERRFLEQRRAEHLATLRELDDVLLKNAEQWFVDNKKDATRWKKAVLMVQNRPVQAERRPDVFSTARAAMMSQRIPESDFPPKLVGFTPEQFGRERVARKGLERQNWEFDRYEPFALAVYSGRTPDLKSVSAPVRIPANRLTTGELEETCILAGGDPFVKGVPVKPGVLSVLNAVPQPPLVEQIEGRRLAFAEWVASPQNSLTTRAIVNRIWMWHFSEPLAGNPNNFGSTGKRPTHPELLDWLAATFVEGGWSVKSLHRQIMLSAAYRRSSLGSSNTTVAAFQPRRLTAEELRDAMLAATGELNRELGGIPNRPEINLEVALQPRQVMGTFAAAWVPNPLPTQRHRRSIYALKLRGLNDPLLEVFNAPAPDFSCERRDATTVTPQVFALFNGQGTHARALALAARVVAELGRTNGAPQILDEQAIERCFELVFGRLPTNDERTACLTHWRAMQGLHRKSKPKPIQPPLVVRREAVEENTGEKFSFDERLHSNTDFVPDLQPSDCDARTRALAEICLVLFNSNEFCYVD